MAVTGASKKKSAVAQPAGKKSEPDWDAFPHGTVARYERLLCLNCIFKIFTKQLDMSPRAAYLAVKRHTPSPEDLTGPQIIRPFFITNDKNGHCPNCDSAKRWHALLVTWRIEGGKLTDKPRRAVAQSLPEEQFALLEAKASRQELLFQWLDSLGRRFDFEQDAWMMDAARLYLERVEPKTDWGPIFEKIRLVRRSSRLDEGWEADAERLFLAPALYDELLLLQYLISRSHKAGGRTFEGRLTLPELMGRLRRRGYLREHGIGAGDAFDALERLVNSLGESDESVKLYYVVDRRDLLEKLKTVYARYAA